MCATISACPASTAVCTLQEFDGALALALQPPRRTHPLQLTVQLPLQQVGRVAIRTARGGWTSPAEPQGGKVERPGEGIDDPAGTIRRHQLIEQYREQRPWSRLSPRTKPI